MDSSPDTKPKNRVSTTAFGQTFEVPVAALNPNPGYQAHLDARAHHRNPIWSPFIKHSDWAEVAHHLASLPDFEVGELVYYQPNQYCAKALYRVIDVKETNLSPTGYFYTVQRAYEGFTVGDAGVIEGLWGLNYELAKGPECFWSQDQVMHAQGFFLPPHHRVRTAKRTLFE